MPGLTSRCDSFDVKSLWNDLAAGADPVALVGWGGLAAVDLIAAVAHAALRDGEGPPRAHWRPLHPKLVEAFSIEALGRLFPGAGREEVLALAAGLYQVLDAWEASHAAAQEADDLGERAVSAYWHAIAHRREPDPGNAAYWFRRVGRHAIFPELAALVEGRGWGELLRDGAWDPIGFVHYCGRARPRSAEEHVALRVQVEEMDLLLGATVEALGVTD